MENVRVRFAPSPTGFLHIGNARTALFNYLFARHHKGELILRIEDTDIERSKDEFADQILRDLKWLGIAWDEGPDIGGAYGPYKQSLRQEVYHEALKKLEENGHAYPCYCSSEELDVMRKKALANGEVPKYDNRCRHLSDAQRKKFESEGRRPTIRFKMPDTIICIADLIRGDVVFDTSRIGDFVIFKSDGGPSFHFAVVVDDDHMRITHILRGEDHLSNTPRHMALYEALGAESPQYAHMSMILGGDGARLSKRHGATSVEQYRSLGYLPEALRNYLALLGWSPGDDKEIVSLEEMCDAFSVECMTKSAAIFDQQKLDWLSGVYIREASLERLANLAIPYLREAGYLSAAVGEDSFAKIQQVMGATRGYLHCLSEIPQHVGALLKDDLILNHEDIHILQEESSQTVLSAFQKKIQARSDVDVAVFSAMIKEIQSETSVKGKKLYMPLRVALTGKAHGPELHMIVPILGKERCEKRITKALNMVTKKEASDDT